GGGHFHVAAGQAKVIRPEGVLAPPVHRRVQYGFQFAHEDAAMDLLLHGVGHGLPFLLGVLAAVRVGTGQGVFHGIPLVVWRSWIRCLRCGAQSSAPRRQRYANPTSRITTKIAASIRPAQPLSRTDTAQANRNRASTSKMTKNMVTR